MHVLRELVVDTIAFLNHHYKKGETILISTPPLAPPQVEIAKPQPFSSVSKERMSPVSSHSQNDNELLAKNTIIPKQLEKKIPHQAPDAMRALLSQIAPHFHLRETPLPDNETQKRPLTAPVVILTTQETEQELLFLKGMAKAIHETLLPTKLIAASRLEQENRWAVFLEDPALEWILLSHSTLDTLIHLKQFYKKIPSRKEQFLRAKRLILLQPIHHYITTPALKKELWNFLKSCLQPSS